jgi:hypothetical protein
MPTIDKEEAMPLDGTTYESPIRSLDKMDQVIDLLGDEMRWCKARLETSDGRHCIAGAIIAVGAGVELRKPIQLAIKQVTGHRRSRIEVFNDDPLTTHALVMKVLLQARDNVAAAAPSTMEHEVTLLGRLRRVFG